MAVPTTALFAALSAAMSSDDLPPYLELGEIAALDVVVAELSKLLPEPGSTITLGPLGSAHTSLSQDRSYQERRKFSGVS